MHLAAMTESAAAQEILARFEAELDPARPAAGSGVTIVGYGEVSTVFSLAALPAFVCKRMAGFHDAAGVARYLEVVHRYIALLEALGVRVAETTAVPIRPPAGGHVVYLLQPKLDPAGLGNQVLRSADDRVLLACIDQVLAHVRTVLLANRSRADGRTVTVDAQLSNWHFPLDDGGGSAPTLIDVGTPFMRFNGVDELDLELFLAPVPAFMRPLYRRLRLVEHYIDDYFDARKILTDLLGNFHKEGRPDRIDLVLEHINRWLSDGGATLGARAIRRESVDRYYRKDAQLLELFLKVRRFDRFLRTRVLQQRYNFVLPGPIRR
jgi:hypothetical protein